jgi:Tfp pilus assembly protein PilN
MIRRCIGIEIGSYYLRAVQIARTGEQFLIEKVFDTQTRRSTDSLPDILQALSGQFGFDRRAEVAISLGPDEVFYRNLETDFAALEQIRSGKLSTLEYNFPIQPGEIVAGAYSYRQLPGERYSVLAAATARAAINEKLQILSEAKMQPGLIEAAVFAVHSTVIFNHPEARVGQAIIANIDDEHLAVAVTQDNDILIVRNVPIAIRPDSEGNSQQEQVAQLLSSEVQVTWRRVFGAEIGQEIKVYLAANGAFDYLQSLVEENLHCQVIIVDPVRGLVVEKSLIRNVEKVSNGADPYAKVKTTGDYKMDFPIYVAEGLALRVLAPEKTKGIDFLQQNYAGTKQKLKLKKEFVTCAALVGAIAVCWVIGLFLRLSYLEDSFTGLKNQIRDVFQDVLPEEKNIVNPLVQLEQKLESFHKDYQLFASFCPQGSEPLEVLRTISANMPSQANMKINDLLIAADTVRIIGSCDSFESVYDWQRILREVSGFNIVDVQDVQKEPKSGIVRFTMVLSSAKYSKVMEQK